MQGHTKLRVFSQNPYPDPKIEPQQKERVATVIKKVPSYLSDGTTPMRLTQKIAAKPYQHRSRGQKLSELEKGVENKQQAQEEPKLRLLQKKISEHKLQDSPYLTDSKHCNPVSLVGTKLGSEDASSKAKIQQSRKPKSKKQLLYFSKGNNHQLLRDIFIKQYNFAQTVLKEQATFCWLQGPHQKESTFPSSKSTYQDHLPQIAKTKIDSSPVIYNYLEGQSEITNKERLFRNMKKCYPAAIGTYIPSTFIIDFKQDESQVEERLLEFMTYYFSKDACRRPRNKSITIKNYFADITISPKVMNRIMERSLPAEAVPKQEGADKSMWILKPTSLNRGRGIHVFSTLKQLSKLLSESSFQISVKMYNENMKPKSYIVQEYISRPLLLDGFKFDMRFWVLIQVAKTNGKKHLKAHLFQQGYSRLASIKYDFNDSPENNEEETSPQKKELSVKEGESQQMRKQHQSMLSKDRKAYINNRFIHLTNNAVQKDAKQYGQFCEGNQLSISDTLAYFTAKDPSCPLNEDSLRQRIKKIVGESLNSVKEKLISSNIPKTFQLLGYDFLLDQDYKLWFIEVNSNPCLQQSSALLSNLLRKMLEGLVTLTALEEGKGPDTSEGWVSLF